MCKLTGAKEWVKKEQPSIKQIKNVIAKLKPKTKTAQEPQQYIDAMDYLTGVLTSLLKQQKRTEQTEIRQPIELPPPPKDSSLSYEQDNSVKELQGQSKLDVFEQLKGKLGVNLTATP
ncbi:hypothetical protein AB4571_15355 [Vibrio breoganii]|uniref:hypothetical protein n=1 Tax=Vibrio breoganii TaxID=553239 RepID=UPI000C83E4C7|nr:hypothetical protein [Vibrio breoganii]PML13835.1 hypothetical protein BCT84_12655 [Vibrio breoganii]